MPIRFPAGLVRRAAAAAVSSLIAAAVQAEPFVLTVLHVNDTHSYAAGMNEKGLPCYQDEACKGGYARIAAMIDAEKQKGGNVLALDAGDVWQGSLFFGTGGRDFARSVERAMPYDAVTLGNHEFDLGCDELAQYVVGIDKPVLAANLLKYPACPMSQAPVEPYRIFSFASHRVAVVGLANDEVLEVSKACPHTAFADRRESLQKTVDALQKQGVEHIVVLSHIGYDADLILAREVPGVDLFVGGHTHSILGHHKGSEGPYPTVVAHPDGTRTLVVQAGRQTQFLGSLTLSFNEKGIVASYSSELRELTADLPRSRALEAIVGRQGRVVAKSFEKSLARTSDMGEDGLDYCRIAECPAGMITADAYLDFGRPYGAQAAMLNSGSIRSALPAGELTLADLQNVHPFGNRLHVLEMTGAEIRASLEHGLTDPEVTGPRLLQTTGIRYEVRPAEPLGRRLGRVEIRDGTGRWRILTDTETVRVVVSDYLKEGGDGFADIRRAAQRPGAPYFEEGVTDLAALVRYVRSQAERHAGVLPAPEGGRIRGLTGSK